MITMKHLARDLVLICYSVYCSIRIMTSLRKTPSQRFWEKVKKGDTCWEWLGAKRISNGYGVLQKGRRGEGLIQAHRFSYILHFGEITGKDLVLHSCNNKLCVNPEHLSLGNHSRNLAEAWRDGLRKKTVHIGNLNKKLSAEQSQQMANEYKTGSRAVDLARKFGVSKGTIFKHLKKHEVSVRANVSIS